MSYRFFISSSSEQKETGKAIEANLQAEGFEPTLWLRGAHGPAQYNLEALVGQAESSDFAVFVFAPDDQATIRGDTFGVVRDNVLFELGLFIGILGRTRCFILSSMTSSDRLPSDLDGLTLLKIGARRSDGDLRRSVGPVTTEIAQVAHREAGAAASSFSDNELAILRACQEKNSPSNHTLRALGSAPTEWDDRLCMRFLRLLESGLISCTGPTEVEATRSGQLLAQSTRRP